jgi:hypothetical protein
MTEKTPLNFAADLGAACGLLLGDSIRRAEVREAVLGDGRGVPGSRSEGSARGCGVASGGRPWRRGRAACESCRQVRTFFAATREGCRNARAHGGGGHGRPCVTTCPRAESRGRRAGSKSGTGLMTGDDRRSGRDVSGKCLGNWAENDPPSARVPLAAALSSIPRGKNGAGALNGPLGVLSCGARRRNAGPSALLAAHKPRSARHGFKKTPRNWASASGKMARDGTGTAK